MVKVIFAYGLYQLTAVVIFMIMGSRTIVWTYLVAKKKAVMPTFYG